MRTVVAASRLMCTRHVLYVYTRVRYADLSTCCCFCCCCCCYRFCWDIEEEDARGDISGHTCRVFFLRGGLTNRSAAVSFPQFSRLSSLTSRPHPAAFSDRSYPSQCCRFSTLGPPSRNAPFCRVSSPHLSRLRLVRSPVRVFHLIPVMSFLNFLVATHTPHDISSNFAAERWSACTADCGSDFRPRWRRPRGISK